MGTSRVVIDVPLFAGRAPESKPFVPLNLLIGMQGAEKSARIALNVPFVTVKIEVSDLRCVLTKVGEIMRV
jgi:hypothetical protein